VFYTLIAADHRRQALDEGEETAVPALTTP
jgi:hypothetical protein